MKIKSHTISVKARLVTWQALVHCDGCSSNVMPFRNIDELFFDRSERRIRGHALACFPCFPSDVKVKFPIFLRCRAYERHVKRIACWKHIYPENRIEGKMKAIRRQFRKQGLNYKVEFADWY